MFVCYYQSKAKKLSRIEKQNSNIEFMKSFNASFLVLYEKELEAKKNRKLEEYKKDHSRLEHMEKSYLEDGISYYEYRKFAMYVMEKELAKYSKTHKNKRNVFREKFFTCNSMIL